MKLPRHIQHWDDERRSGNGVLVTLSWGWSFLSGEHQGARGFDQVGEAQDASRLVNVFPCLCEKCVKGNLPGVL